MHQEKFGALGHLAALCRPFRREPALDRSLALAERMGELCVGVAEDALATLQELDLVLVLFHVTVLVVAVCES
jgi:hypothetical protein